MIIIELSRGDVSLSRRERGPSRWSHLRRGSRISIGLPSTIEPNVIDISAICIRTEGSRGAKPVATRISIELAALEGVVGGHKNSADQTGRPERLLYGLWLPQEIPEQWYRLSVSGSA